MMNGDAASKHGVIRNAAVNGRISPWIERFFLDVELLYGYITI
jgi:hypothetical protein